MKIALGIYLLFSAYQCGSFYEENYINVPKSVKGKFKWLLAFLFFYSCMGAIVIIDFILRSLNWIWKGIGVYTQINFFWQFYFTKKWKDISDETLKSLNEFIKNYPNPDSWKTKLQRKCLQMINKRNNYTYTKPKNERTV